MRSFAFAANYVFQGYMVRERLRAELRQVLPTPTSTATWEELEKLPYLRLFGCRAWHQMKSYYNEHVIPPGYEPSLQTPMSTSIYFVHHNPVISPDPHNFNPERWFKASEDFNLRKYLVPFTKGSRKCVGVNLVIMEIYLTVATYVRRFVLEIQSVDPGNIRVARDRVVGFPETGTLQICAKVKSTIQV
ncbi:cytochrome P450 [Penicillium antarcticum]|nr:cytochrome P450 [Penicillium antarcticum]KAJ5288397.1 cytochrome P450 [Penicillium antarcticum]